MRPRHGEADDLVQQPGFLTEALQMIDRLLDETLGLAARSIRAEQRNQCRLVLHPVLADPLSEERISVFRLQQIVSDLECEAEAMGVAAQPGAKLLRRAPHDGTRLDAPAE